MYNKIPLYFLILQKYIVYFSNSREKKNDRDREELWKKLQQLEISSKEVKAE